jgi:hypothetical protein
MCRVPEHAFHCVPDPSNTTLKYLCEAFLASRHDGFGFIGAQSVFASAAVLSALFRPGQPCCTAAFAFCFWALGHCIPSYVLFGSTWRVMTGLQLHALPE